MKRRLFILIGVLLCMALVAGGLYIYFRLNVRQIFNAQASALTSRRVEAKRISVYFPATFVIEGLSVDGVMDCARVRAAFDPLSLFARDVRIHSLELDAPVVVWEARQLAAPTTSSPGAGAAVALHQPRLRSLVAATCLVREGVLKIRREDAQGVWRTYTLDHLQLRLSSLPLTNTPARTGFFLTASLASLNVPFLGHFLKMDGWLNWHARDMEARAQVVDDDGRVGLEARGLSRQNDLQVSGSVRLTPQQGPQATGKKMGLLEDVALNLLASTETDLDVGFSFRTKMDRFEPGKINLSGQVTTGLNSLATSGNIVAGLEAMGAELFRMSAPSP